MSASPDPSVDSDRALYATLGLTGFGAGNGPTRKRRVGDAFTEPDRSSSRPDASGSNSVPLGARRESDDSAVPASSGEEAAKVVGASADAEPTPLAATSANQLPAPDAPDPTAGMKASEARKYWKKVKREQTASVGSGVAGFLAYGQSLPEPAPPQPARFTENLEKITSTRVDLPQSTDEGSAADEDCAYFKPSFIEDPWAGLLSRRI